MHRTDIASSFDFFCVIILIAKNEHKFHFKFKVECWPVITLYKQKKKRKTATSILFSNIITKRLSFSSVVYLPFLLFYLRLKPLLLPFLRAKSLLGLINFHQMISHRNQVNQSRDSILKALLLRKSLV